MRASRRTACSSDSSTTMPAPSPHTKPSRPASKGREAFSGSSLRVDIAFIEQKPATRLLLVDVLERVEVADLAGDARRKVGGVELGDRADPGLPLLESRPELLGAVAKRGERPEPGDDDATRVHQAALRNCP